MPTNIMKQADEGQSGTGGGQAVTRPMREEKANPPGQHIRMKRKKKKKSQGPESSP